MHFLFLNLLVHISLQTLASASSQASFVVEHNGVPIIKINKENTGQFKNETLVVARHPNYKDSKEYLGVYLKSLLDQKGLKISEKHYVVINCVDGYRPVLDGKYFTDGSAFVAYRELSPDKNNMSQDGLWTKVDMGDRMASPGPYYLVWPSKAGHQHSWPYQMVSLNVVDKEKFDEFSKIAPDENSSGRVQSGFSTFKKICLVCHSIKYAGPKGKAPDLAFVKGYRDNQFIMNRVRKGEGQMPAFPKDSLSDSELENVIEYLDYIYKEK